MLPTDAVKAKAATAYVWGFPYVEAARLRLARTSPDDPFEPRIDTSPGAALNNIGRQRRPSDPRYRAGVGVSTDTLYTSAWLDLSGEPMVLDVPRIENRYYSFQAGNADTSSDLTFGWRTHGSQMPPVFLCGPSYDGPAPAGMLEVRSTTRYLNLPGRILFDPADPHDLAVVHTLQDSVRLLPLERFLAGAEGPNPPPLQRALTPPRGTHPALCFLHELGGVVREEVFGAADRALLEEFRVIGLSDSGFDEKALGPAALDTVVAGLTEGARLVRKRSLTLGTQAGGWTINYAGPRFGHDYLLRAAVAREQIYVAVPEEGLYPLGKVDSDGVPLDGGSAYRIRFAPDRLPPVRAFWSVTAYSADGFLVPNEAGIYSLGDRSGLIREESGSVEVHVSRAPGSANWLPAPAGEFYLMLRLFAPEPEALDGRWLPPAIERVGP